MRILKITKQNFNQAVKEAVKAIRNGQVVIYPTDTVYIPAADASNKEAVRKVFLLKKRSLKKPIPVFIKDIRTAKKLARINKKQESFLQLVWPGRITVVLKRKKTKMRLYGVDQETIALRIPDFKLINFLLKKLNKPLVGTSANVSGKPASGILKQVLRQFGKNKHQLNLIVDAGKLLGKPSTVVDLTTSPPRILRN